MYCTQTTAILLSFTWMNVVLQPNYAEFALVTHVYDMYWIHHFFTPKLWTSIINHSVSCLQGLNWGVGIFYFLTHFHGISFYIHTEIHNEGDKPHYAENEDVCGKSLHRSPFKIAAFLMCCMHTSVYMYIGSISWDFSMVARILMFDLFDGIWECDISAVTSAVKSVKRNISLTRAHLP